MVKHISSFLASFRVRVTLALVLGMFFMVLTTGLVVRQIALSAQLEQLRGNLKVLANIAALSVDPEMVRAIPLTREGVQTEAFRAVSEKLVMIKQENPLIGYIYILARTDREKTLQFVADADPYLAKKGNVTAYPGDPYDATPFPQMLAGFKAPSVDPDIAEDSWGKMISGYAPIRDKQGETVAILGIDVMASDIYEAQKAISGWIFLVLQAGTLLSVAFGLWFSFGITRPVKALGEGIRRVSQGDLLYRLKISGKDEISELGRDFNHMAEDLRLARQKNMDYFYGVMQSLVRIVEARDPYTRGHSERVADYAVEIAARMGFSKQALEVLRQAGVLHDIGKLGIHEDVLTKSGKLTAEEWELLRNHPVIGEDILRPVFFDPEMLAVVRGHHERYDGTGYPDQLAGDDINALAQVLSVADAYDAMTSTRPYREAFPKEMAIKELRNNRNAQFNPAIADVFISILNEKND